MFKLVRTSSLRTLQNWNGIHESVAQQTQYNI